MSCSYQAQDKGEKASTQANERQEAAVTVEDTVMRDDSAEKDGSAEEDNEQAFEQSLDKMVGSISGEEDATRGSVPEAVPTPIVKARPTAVKARPTATCSCNSDIKDSLVHGIKKAQDMTVLNRLLVEWADYRDQGKFLCLKHLQELGGAIQLQTRGISNTTLGLRLEVVKRAAEHGILDKLERIYPCRTQDELFVVASVVLGVIEE